MVVFFRIAGFFHSVIRSSSQSQQSISLCPERLQSPATGRSPGRFSGWSRDCDRASFFSSLGAAGCSSDTQTHTHKLVCISTAEKKSTPALIDCLVCCWILGNPPGEHKDGPINVYLGCDKSRVITKRLVSHVVMKLGFFLLQSGVQQTLHHGFYGNIPLL